VLNYVLHNIGNVATASPNDASSIILVSSLTSNSRLLKLKEFIPHESNDQTGLSDGCISQKDEFEVAYSVAHVGLFWLSSTKRILDIRMLGLLL